MNIENKVQDFAHNLYSVLEALTCAYYEETKNLPILLNLKAEDYEEYWLSSYQQTMAITVTMPGSHIKAFSNLYKSLSNIPASNAKVRMTYSSSSITVVEKTGEEPDPII